MSKYKIEHYDNFNDALVIWVEIPQPKQKSIILQMMQIDKENYDKRCYGCCIHYDLETNKHCAVTDLDNNAYYIDNSGVKHWFNTVLYEKEIFKYCESEVINKSYN